MNKIGIDVEKPPLSPMAGEPRPTSAPPQYTSQAQLGNITEMKQSSVWYVLSILSTIFCCLPCGVVGVVHAMIAQHDGELARVGPQRTRLRKAKCCTCVAFGLGLLGYALVIAGIVMASRCRHFYNIYEVEDVKDEPYFNRVYDDTVETTPWTAINSFGPLSITPVGDEVWSGEENSEIWERSEENGWEDSQEWGGGGHGRPRGRWGGLRNGNRGRGRGRGGGHDRIYGK